MMLLGMQWYSHIYSQQLVLLQAHACRFVGSFFFFHLFMPQVIRVPMHVLIFNINKDSDVSLTTLKSHILNMGKLYTDE